MQITSRYMGMQNVRDTIALLEQPAIRIYVRYGIDPRAVISQSALENGWLKYVLSGVQTGIDDSLVSVWNDITIPQPSRPVLNSPLIYTNNLFNTQWHDGCGYDFLWCWVSQKQVDGKWFFHWEKMRWYKTVDECLEDWVNILRLPRYKSAWDNRTDMAKFFQGLQDGGWATGDGYAQKLLQTANTMSVV